MPQLRALHHFALAAAVGLVSAAAISVADPAPGEAWKSSPFHGVQNEATGKPIPCVCRYKGQDFKLGASVCMNTYQGTVIARCDLNLNNTTWAPTDEPCVVSMSRPGNPTVASYARHN
jgi:hypothetical protein